MKTIHLLLTGCICTFVMACQSEKKQTAEQTAPEIAEVTFDLPDSLSARRIALVMDLREQVAKRVMPDFIRKPTEGTLIYFNGDHSEVFFPTDKVVDKLGDFEKYSDDYLLTDRTDSIPLHFEVMISFDPGDKNRFYYDHPVEQFLSVEGIGNFYPSVESTGMWATMALHEMFHHYQYNTPEYVAYAKAEMGDLGFDSRDLGRLCREDDHFLPLIKQENKVLMEALAEKDEALRDSLIASYLEKRASRMATYGEAYPHLEKVENYYVLQEGSARYMEYESMKVLNAYAKSPDAPKVENDPKFKGYAEFRDLDLKGDAFSFLTQAGASQYHYAIGFNTMRLLDLLEVEYRDQMLRQPEKGLHTYLEDYLEAMDK